MHFCDAHAAGHTCSVHAKSMRQWLLSESRPSRRRSVVSDREKTARAVESQSQNREIEQRRVRRISTRENDDGSGNRGGTRRVADRMNGENCDRRAALDRGHRDRVFSKDRRRHSRQDERTQQRNEHLRRPAAHDREHGCRLIFTIDATRMFSHRSLVCAQYSCKHTSRPRGCERH